MPTKFNATIKNNTSKVSQTVAVYSHNDITARATLATIYKNVIITKIVKA